MRLPLGAALLALLYLSWHWYSKASSVGPSIETGGIALPLTPSAYADVVLPAGPFSVGDSYALDLALSCQAEPCQAYFEGLITEPVIYAATAIPTGRKEYRLVFVHLPVAGTYHATVFLELIGNLTAHLVVNLATYTSSPRALRQPLLYLSWTVSGRLPPPALPCALSDLYDLRGFWDSSFTSYTPFRCQISDSRLPDRVLLKLFGDSNTRFLFRSLCALNNMTLHSTSECSSPGSVIALNPTLPVWWASLPLPELNSGAPFGSSCNQSWCRGREATDFREFNFWSFGSHDAATSKPELRRFFRSTLRSLLVSRPRCSMMALTTAVDSSKIPPTYDRDKHFRTNYRVSTVHNDLIRDIFAGYPILDLWSPSLTHSIGGQMADAVHFRKGIYSLNAAIVTHAVQQLISSWPCLEQHPKAARSSREWTPPKERGRVGQSARFKSLRSCVKRPAMTSLGFRAASSSAKQGRKKFDSS